MLVFGRRYQTGSKEWKSVRETADGRNVVIEVSTSTGVKEMSVRREPLLLIAH